MRECRHEICSVPVTGERDKVGVSFSGHSAPLDKICFQQLKEFPFVL